VDRLTYILDISPASGNKFVPVGLAAAAAAREDPQCAVVVAQAFVWRLGDGSSQRGRIGIYFHRVPRQRQQIRSAGLLSRLFALLFWSLLQREVYKKYCSVADLVRPMLTKRTRRWHWLVFC
jgi:hypothetical protein